MLLAVTSATVISMENEPFEGRNVKDPYPLQHILKYKLINKSNKSDMQLMSEIIKNLDIENNERYFKVGVKYIDDKAYEIPLQELEDFGLRADFYNTYCNIFVIDVLNIMANTTGDETYRILKNPVRANDMRGHFEESEHWVEVSSEDAVILANNGNVVIMSYVETPTGHVAIVRPDSNKNEMYLWNVGAINKEKLLMDLTGNVKYFVHK